METIPKTDLAFPNFDALVPDNGYRWWYLDALSDDGERGLTIIVFIGSVFSPYYASRRRSAPANPSDHCAINVALYGRGARRWAMTERGADRLGREHDWLRIGDSSMEADGDSIVFHIREWASPLPRRVIGTVRMRQSAISDAAFTLDNHGRHSWWPVSPSVDVEVDMAVPDLAWQGTGYFDTNWGDEPLEAGFREWCWGRARVGDNSVIHYDVVRADGAQHNLMLEIERSGRVHERPEVSLAGLPATRIWRVHRNTRSEGTPARLVRTLEDTPFYARSLIETQLLGSRVVAFHESLSLQRFSRRWVQRLLPFRMPRLP